MNGAKLMWNKMIVLALLSLASGLWAAEYSIDNTCGSCSRRLLDSLNVHDRRDIRVNQVGFRPQDSKKAFVANPVSRTFKVVNAETGSEAWSGTLTAIGPTSRPGMWINGAFNSIASVYQFGDSSAAAGTENLFEANFSNLSTGGRYYIVVDADTSATFRINDKIYNYIFENSLKFFGVNRCGDTHSWIHGPCHLKDGSAIGKTGALAGGWHDCGDHFKVSETLGYSALLLSLTYALWPEKAEDFFGASYNDTLPFGTDGIPDLLWESKVGADFIFKLYKASVEDGLLASNDMYHSVGVDMADHHYWDVPERQDAQPVGRGGPPRVVARGIGGNVAGMYTASLAFFAWGWELFDKPYSDSLMAAARDMYDKLVIPKRNIATTGLGGFYTGGGQMHDDPAMAALALWFATKDPKYKFDLIENTALGTSATAQWNEGEFAAGLLSKVPFHHGGWTSDYQQVNAFVIYAFAKLILANNAKAAEYGITPVVRDSLLEDAVMNLRQSISIGSNGATQVTTSGGGRISVDQPYGGVFTSVDWGYNRYNMGMVNELFMMWDITGETEYLNIGLDNLYYNMGMNPWDISFLMGAGDKNLQHPHNRAANPDGYNAGGFPYEYTCPKGALMGGSKPTKLLVDDWNQYTVTETCIDFSAQWVLPSQMLAKDLPPDNVGPLFTNVQATPISGTSALISWETNELAQVTVYLSASQGGAILQTLPSSGLSMAAAVQANGLTPGARYYFYLEGQDIRRNRSTDDNHGEWYTFVMTANPAIITSVRICQVDDQSAKIYWWTPNGAYPGSVKYGSSASALNSTTIGDNGQPVMFHEVSLKGLTPGTTYYFDVVSGTTTDNNGGNHYQFTTTAQPLFVNYTITIKPTKKKNPSAHFYLEVMNNESRPYKGLEVRFYFSTTSVSASTVNVQGFDNAIFDVGGTYHSTTPVFGAPVQVAGTNQWYIPITIPDTLPVAGRARIEMEMHTNGWGDLAWSELVNSWSLIPHTAAGDPQYFEGVNLSRGTVYTGPDHIESVNGVPEVTYVRDPYISAHFNGNHIYGYPPNYASGNMPVMIRDMYMTFSSPFRSPQTNLETDDFNAIFTGTSWVKPTGNLDLVEMNGSAITATYPNVNRRDSNVFNRDVSPLSYGNNRFEFVSWHNANANNSTDPLKKYDCQCVFQRSNIEVDTLVVPRQKRFVRFDPADTVQFYQGKRKMVRVMLTDSAGNIITGEDISLNVGAGVMGVTFYSDPTSTVAITRVTLVNGQAQFYVGYETPLTQNLVSSLNFSPENPRSEFIYITQNPVLIIEPPPPWPIIESAVLRDTDCNQIPDALDVVVSTEFNPGTYDFTGASFVFEGDTIAVTPANAVISGRNLRLNFSSPSGQINTSATGHVWIQVTVTGQGLKPSDDAYSDGIGPTVLAVSVMENLTNNPHDSLFVQFSEPVSAGTEWMFHVYAPNGSAVTDTPAVVSARIFNESRNIWVYVIEAPAGGTQPVVPDAQLQLKSGAPLLDRMGNPADACTFAKLTVSVKRRPIPMTYASISDGDGDGIAERVEVRFVAPVDQLHQPDSMSVIFGFFAPETLVTGAWTWNTNRTIAILQFNNPFSFGITAGTYTGVYNGNELNHAGLVTQHKGLGADYESLEIVAEDLVGPVIIAARFGEGRSFDTLTVNFSEPVLSVNDSIGKSLLIRERDLVAFQPMFWRLSGDGTTMAAFYTSESVGYVTEGDRVRLEGLTSRFTDDSGNMPSENATWVTVTGKRSVKVVVDISNLRDVSRVTPDMRSYGLNPPGANESMRITVLNPNTGRKDVWLNGQRVASNLDTNQYKHIGPTFLMDVSVPRGSGYGEEPFWDSVVVDIDLLLYSNLGTYVNRMHQQLVLRDGSYLDIGNKVHVQVEWTAQGNKGVVSHSGRSAASGAYVARAMINSKMMTAYRSGESMEQLVRYNNKSNQSKNWLFGYIREK